MKKNKFCLRFRLMKLRQMLCIHSYQYCYYSVCVVMNIDFIVNDVSIGSL